MHMVDQNTATCNNIYESHRHHAAQKKLETKELCDSISVTFLNWQKWSIVEITRKMVAFVGRGGIVRLTRKFLD